MSEKQPRFSPVIRWRRKVKGKGALLTLSTTKASSETRTSPGLNKRSSQWFGRIRELSANRWNANWRQWHSCVLEKDETKSSVLCSAGWQDGVGVICLQEMGNQSTRGEMKWRQMSANCWWHFQEKEEEGWQQCFFLPKRQTLVFKVECVLIKLSRLWMFLCESVMRLHCLLWLSDPFLLLLSKLPSSTSHYFQSSPVHLLSVRLLRLRKLQTGIIRSVNVTVAQTNSPLASPPQKHRAAQTRHPTPTGYWQRDTTQTRKWLW